MAHIPALQDQANDSSSPRILYSSATTTTRREMACRRTRRTRLAGSYSGIVTTLRNATASDLLYAPGSYLFQYEAIFKFNAVANTPLQMGQVTARGVVYLASNLSPLETRTFAITGGTGAYTTARGQVTEQQPPSSAPASTEDWLLNIS
jgi:hypothetical protein